MNAAERTFSYLVDMSDTPVPSCVILDPADERGHAAISWAAPIAAVCLGLSVVLLGSGVAVAAPGKPNVIVIVTDDQGFGELGVTGNPVVRTPHIDGLAKQSVSLTNFNVMAVCSPTRAGLMTGRYHYRAGVTDTWMGASMIDPAETTLGEMFAAAGYRTGLFGKWHLGDNFPRRPMDKGFQDTLVLNGGGLAQPGDPPDPADERGAYFNATLLHNGKWEKTDGYVSDVLTDATLHFVDENRSRPFFACLTFNCPHSPHQVPDRYRDHYPAEAFRPDRFPADGHPMQAKQNAADLAKAYGMVENIDDNVARVLRRLDELHLADDTIVVLLSDNGCQDHKGFNAGFRGYKGSPFEGGIHQFCFVRWPAVLKAGRAVDRLAAHLDLAPTLLDLCHVPKPDRVRFDGESLAPLLRGEPVQWADRVLVFQWHRGDAPVRYRSFAARSQDWKLVQPGGAGERRAGRPAFQLYNMAHDRLEMHDVAAEHPDQVARLTAAYDAWFDDITASRDFRQPQRIDVGAPQENPTLLTRQDWRGPDASWGPNGIGYWELNVVRDATCDVVLRFEPLSGEATATLHCGTVTETRTVRPGESTCTFGRVRLPAGPTRLEPVLTASGGKHGVQYVEVRKLD